MLQTKKINKCTVTLPCLLTFKRVYISHIEIRHFLSMWYFQRILKIKYCSYILIDLSAKIKNEETKEMSFCHEL